MKSSDKMWSPGEGNGNPLQYSCLESLKGSMKRQKDMSLKDEDPPPPPGQKVSNMLLGKCRGQFLIAAERMELLDQSENDAQLWTCLVVKVKSSAGKNNIA